MSFSNVRIKDFIKKFLDDTASSSNTSTAKVLEQLIKNIYEEDRVVILNGRLFGTGVQLSDKLRVEANALEVFYYYWRELTSMDYQTSLSFEYFIDIYNFIALDVSFEILARQIGIERFNNNDINNYNSAYFARKFIFEENNDAYKEVVNKFVDSIDVDSFRYLNKKSFFDILKNVLASKVFKGLIDKNTLSKIAILRNYGRKIVEASNYHSCEGKKYEYDYLSKAPGLKNKIIKLIESNYNIELVDNELFYDMVTIAQKHTSTKNIVSGKIFKKLLEISIVCIEDFKDDNLFNDSLVDYLNSKLNAKSKDLLENLKYTIETIYTKNYIDTETIYYYYRAPMEILETCIFKMKTNIMSNNRIKQLVKDCLIDLVNSSISNYSINGLYWYEMKHRGFFLKSKYFSLRRSSRKIILSTKDKDVNCEWYFPVDVFYKFAMINLEPRKQISMDKLIFEDVNYYFFDNGKRITIETDNYKIEFNEEETNRFTEFCKELNENKEYLKDCKDYFKYHGFI